MNQKGSLLATLMFVAIVVGHWGTQTATAHQAVMDLVPISKVTHTVVKSGAWSNAKTWADNKIPGNNARVFVPKGKSLTVDGKIDKRIKTLRIDGVLRFKNDVDTALPVETLVSMMSGKLIIGTKSKPIQSDVSAKILFIDTGKIDRKQDPELLSRGALLLGQTTIFGSAKTSWTSLARHPRAGQKSLSLATAPKGWKVGDELIVAGTDPFDPASDEVVTIKSIMGKRVLLNSELERDHTAPERSLKVHVANNTRNVTFVSEGEKVSRRGHVMFMHTLKVNVHYASFLRLGRTNKRVRLNDSIWPDLEPERQRDLNGTNVRGRYSVHFHRGGTDPKSKPATVKGCSVIDDAGWAYVNHSANVVFEDNVAYNTLGAAYNTEAGDEIGSFINNIAIRCFNPDDPLNQPFDPEDPLKNTPDAREEWQDYGWQGDGFWFHGPFVTSVGNVVSGATGHAYVWWPEGLLEKGLGEKFFDAGYLPNGKLIGPKGTMVQIWDVPIKKFSHNEAYSVSKGIQIYYLHTEFFAGSEEAKGLKTVPQSYKNKLKTTIENSTVWAVRQAAVQTAYATRLSFKNMRLVGSPESDAIGMDLDHFFSDQRMNLTNINAKGFAIGIATPTAGKVTLNGGTLANLIDVQIKNVEREPRDMKISNLKFAGLPKGLREFKNLREEISLELNLDPFGSDGFEETPKDALFFLMPDRITLSHGQHKNAQIYFEGVQEFDHVPVTEDDPTGGQGIPVPEEYIGLMNMELADEFNLGFHGAITPPNTKPANFLFGGQIGPRTKMLDVPPLVEGDEDDDDDDDDEDDED